MTPEAKPLEKDDFSHTASGIPLKAVYGPADRPVEPPAPGRLIVGEVR